MSFSFGGSVLFFCKVDPRKGRISRVQVGLGSRA